MTDVEREFFDGVVRSANNSGADMDMAVEVVSVEEDYVWVAAYATDECYDNDVVPDDAKTFATVRFCVGPDGKKATVGKWLMLEVQLDPVFPGQLVEPVVISPHGWVLFSLMCS